MITAAVKKVGKWRTKEKEAGSQVAEIHRITADSYTFLKSPPIHLFTYLTLNIRTKTLKLSILIWRRRGPAFTHFSCSHLRSCPGAGSGWHLGYLCWWWVRWGRCRGSRWGQFQGRYSGGPSTVHQDKTLKVKGTRAHDFLTYGTPKKLLTGMFHR